MYYLKHYGFCDSNYLSHHGIKGQKWGKRNGPPYPLSDVTHDKVVKRAGKVSSRARAGETGTILDDIAPWAAAIGLMLSPMIIEAAIKGASNVQSNKKAIEIKDKRKTTIDEKTGFNKLNKPDSIEDAAKKVNPRYDVDYASNARNNCVFCSTAYEMRRRGYDVIAKPSTKPQLISIFQDAFPGAKFKLYPPESKSCIEIIRDSKGKMTDLQIKDFDMYRASQRKAIRGENEELAIETMTSLKKEKNSRGQLSIVWPYGGGHSISYEVKNNKLTVIDPQNGKVYDTDYKIEKLLASSISASSYRLDNCDIDPEVLRNLIE